MTGPAGRAVIRIFTAPDVACGRGATWASAVGFIGERLRLRFGEAVVAEHLDMFSLRSFGFPTALEAIRRGAQLPLVLVGERVISEGAKLSDSRIARALEVPGVTAGGGQGEM